MTSTLKLLMQFVGDVERVVVQESNTARAIGARMGLPNTFIVNLTIHCRKKLLFTIVCWEI